MKFACALSLLVLAGASDANPSNPLQAAIQLMDQLNSKLVADGVAEDKAFKKYMEWCDETTQNQRFGIDAATTKKAELEAAIFKADSDLEAATAAIEELAGKIGKADSEVKDATLIRKKEEKEFLKAEVELEETLSALTRAISIITKEMAKNPAAFAQMDTSSMGGLVSAIGAVVDAASLTGLDRRRLQSFVQQAQEDDALGSPDPAAYKSHSTSILDTLQDLKAKAEEQLATLRKEESNTAQNYRMLKASLDAEMAYNAKEKTETEQFKSDTEGQKATDTADLAATGKLLKDTQGSLSTSQDDCMKTAADHDNSVANRNQEIKTIASAKKVLMETTSGAAQETYSFIQRSSSNTKSRAQQKGEEVAGFIRRLSQKQHSEDLAQLASKVSALMQYGSSAGSDPFVKVKGLIRDMIAKLESEAMASAKEKAYCDEQMAKTEAKQSELSDDIAKMTAKIDLKSAQSAKLKEEVKELQAQLASLAGQQAEMNAVRSDQKAAFDQAKADLELGLQGVNKAIVILRKYYQGDGAALVQQPAKPVFHAKAEGAGGSIIDILEVVESEFAKSLAIEESTESDAVETYETRTQEIKVSTAQRSQSLKYKVQEFKGLDREVAEISGDRKSTNEELASVLQYYAQVKARCIAKPETYEERKARRAAEITGLKEALDILNEETALLQVRKTRSLRSGVLSA
jgi:chromosome segregation ATPase